MAVVLAMPLAGCFGGDDDPVAPGQPNLTLDPGQLELGSGRSGTLTLRNSGRGPARSVQILATAPTSGSATTDRIQARVEPTLISVLEPGDSRTVQITLEVEPGTREGTYGTTVEVRLAGSPVATAPVTLTVNQVRAVRLSETEVELGLDRDFQLWVTNTGSVPLDSVRMVAGNYMPVELGGAQDTTATFDPERLGTLQPGDSTLVSVEVSHDRVGFVPGRYEFRINVLSATGASASADARFRVPQPATLEVSVPSSVVRGDPFAFGATARDSSGVVADEVAVVWSPVPSDAGLIDVDRGLGVAYAPGTLELEVHTGTLSESNVITVAPREGLSSLASVGWFEMCSPGRVVTGVTSRDQRAYVSAIVLSDPEGGQLTTLDVSTLSAPAFLDDVDLAGSPLSSVALGPGARGVIGLDSGDEEPGGLGILDLTDPSAPVLGQVFRESLEVGVVGVDVADTFVFATRNDGFSLVDITDPDQPSLVLSQASEGGPTVVSASGGLAFAQEAGRITILDIGGGGVGGSPSSPVEVGRIVAGEFEAFSGAAPLYDVDTRRLYVSRLDTESVGGASRTEELLAFDLTDLTAPELVASAKEPVTGAILVGREVTDFALDGEQGVLYAAWATRGVVAYDVTGDLFGDLELGRELARSTYDDALPGCSGQHWATSLTLVDGAVLVTDRLGGVVALVPGS